MFEANLDDNTVVRNNLTYPVVARYVRINPQRWNRFISMRIELYGCRFGKDSFVVALYVLLPRVQRSLQNHILMHNGYTYWNYNSNFSQSTNFYLQMEKELHLKARVASHMISVD